MNRAETIAEVIRVRLLNVARKWKRRPVAVALSGGVDSCSVLAALMQTGHKPTVISYTPATHESTDFQMARDTARNLGLRFVPAIVSVAAVDLERYARALTQRGFKTKLEVESLAPMLTILRVAQAEGVLGLFTGDQADGYFINNNWMSRNYDRAQGIPGYLRKHVKEDPDSKRIDALRLIYWDEDRSCSGAIQSLGKEVGLEVVVPYRDRVIAEAFAGSHWRDVNEPRIKEPIRLAFDDWFTPTRCLVRSQPVNLHRGDSLFADTIGRVLMAQPHLAGSWKTPTGLYAAMARGDV